MEQQYPGLKVASDYVLPSYDWAVRRLDSVDGKIQGMLLLAVSVFAGLAAVERLVTGSNGFNWWLLLAVCFLVTALIWGLYARQWGNLILPSPATLYAQCGYTEEEFKLNVLYWAGEHFLQNKFLVERKWAHVNCMAALIAMEVGALFLSLYSTGLP